MLLKLNENKDEYLTIKQNEGHSEFKLIMKNVL